MPMINGVYVPPSITTQREIRDYAADVIRNDPNIPNRDLIYKIGGRFPLDQYDQIGYIQPGIRDARAEIAAAEAMGQTPGAPLDPTSIPTEPGDPIDSGVYVYDVVTILSDPATGATVTNRIQVLSTDPLSEGDVYDRAVDQVMSGVASPAPPPGFSGDYNSIQTILLGVHRGR